MYVAEGSSLSARSKTFHVRIVHGRCRRFSGASASSPQYCFDMEDPTIDRPGQNTLTDVVRQLSAHFADSIRVIV
jgi:hypothetical protein